MVDGAQRKTSQRNPSVSTTKPTPGGQIQVVNPAPVNNVPLNDYGNLTRQDKTRQDKKRR
jgi:hypothetical protein